MPKGATLRQRLDPARAVRLGMSALVIAGALSGCSDSLPSLPKVGELNPFKEKQAPLPGKRIPVLPAESKIAGDLADGMVPIILPEPRLNDSWPQPGGEPNNSAGHLQLTGAIKSTWSADAGKGTNKHGRVLASPIVYDGRIYVLDAHDNVSAFSLSGGSALWRVSLAPTPTETNAKPVNFSLSALNVFGDSESGSYGGGLAAENGRLYAASGYGTVIALDPASGKRVWEKSVGIPFRSSPTVLGDRVYVGTVEGQFFCLSGIDGTELWTVRGVPQQASIGLNTSPAVEGDMLVVPYASGDLVALRSADGSVAWSENLARNRTTSQLASLSDAARPVIDRGIVFAAGHGGRMISTNLKTGERLWSLNIPSTQAPVVAGESVFIVDTSGQLMAITRRDGKLQWTTKLPDTNTWSGPVLAGGTLWLTSNKGHLVGVEPATGKLTGQLSVGEPVYIAPIVAQGRLFVLTDGARLYAFN